MSQGFPSYSIIELERNARDIPDDFGIPSIPEHLLAPLVSASVETPVTSDDLPSDPQEEKFYIDETNMIERRFLPQDTRTFENVRTVDLFASSRVCGTIVETIRVVLNIDSEISSEVQSAFLKGDASISWERILWGKSTSTAILRKSAMKEWGIDDNEIIISGVQREDGYIGGLCLSIMLGISVVTEDTTGKIQVLGVTPPTKESQVIWIQQVPDGYLGVTMTAAEAETRFRKMCDERGVREKTVIDISPGVRVSSTNPILNSFKVNELRDKLKTLGGTPGKKLKTDLVSAILEKSLWGL